MISKSFNKACVKIVLGLFIFTQFLAPLKVHAAVLVDEKAFIADEFVQDVQKYMERVRNIENDYDNPITKSDLNKIEAAFNNIFYVLDLEFNRLKDIDFTTQERLEIESVLKEISLQMSRTLNLIKDKVADDADDNFKKINDNFTAEALTYQGSLEDVITQKTEGTTLNRETALARVSTTQEDLDVIISKLKLIVSNFKNLTSKVESAVATTGNLKTYADDGISYIEDAENQVRKLGYIRTTDSANLRSEVNNINRESDKYISAFINKFSVVASGYDALDLKKTIEFGQSQLTRAYADVISNRNSVDLAPSDVLDRLDALKDMARQEYQDIPTFDSGSIVTAIDNLLEDSNDEDADDLENSIVELKSKANVSSIYEDDFKLDTEYYVDSILDGFERVRKNTYSTTVGAVEASLDTHIAAINSIKSGFEVNINTQKKFDDISEDLEKVLHNAQNSIFELRLTSLSGADQASLNAKIDSLGTAVSTTLDTLNERKSSSLSSYYDELVFDLKGSTAVSSYSLMTTLYNTVTFVAGASGDGTTTPAAVLSYIQDKKNSLSGIENGWGRNMTSETAYRNAEKDITSLLFDIQKQLYRLEGYPFQKSVTSGISANNIGQYFRNLINEAEDSVSLINNSITTEEKDDIERKINKLYSTIDDGVSLLQDAMDMVTIPALANEYADILTDISDEKTKLNRAFTSLNTSSSSSNSNTRIQTTIKEMLADNKTNVSTVTAEIPDILDTYNDFDQSEQDIQSQISDIEKTLNTIYSKTFTYDERKSIQLEFIKVVDSLLDYKEKLQENIESKLNSRQRALQRTLANDIVEFKIIMDQVKIKEEEKTETYDASRNLRDITNQVSRLTSSASSIDKMDTYHDAIYKFVKEFRLLNSYFDKLILNKPVLTAEQTKQLQDDLKNFEKNYKESTNSLKNSIMNEKDENYLRDSFMVYINRYYLVAKSKFDSVLLNGYKETPVVFTELYERKVIEDPKEEEIKDEGNIIEPEGVDTKFEDVKAKNPFSGYIQKLQEKEIISGFADGKFYPEKSVTRAEFVKMAMLGTAVPTTRFKADLVTFGDVSKDDPLAPYIGYAVSKGYINGYSSENFGPQDQITRLDAVRILIRIKSIASINNPEKSAYFSDITNADLATLVDRAYEAKLISGFKDGTFGPYKAITRGETSKIIARAFLEF